MLSTISRILVPISIQFSRISFKRIIVRDIALWGRRYAKPNFPQILAQTVNPPDTQTMAPISPDKELNYEEFIKVKKGEEVITIDVRNKDELEEDGKIEGTVNIPLIDLNFALEHFSAEEFEYKYGIPKPKIDTLILFHCRSGGRSLRALEIALKLGYKNSKHYKGGYNDWLEHTKSKKN